MSPNCTAGVSLVLPEVMVSLLDLREAFEQVYRHMIDEHAHQLEDALLVPVHVCARRQNELTHIAQADAFDGEYVRQDRIGAACNGVVEVAIQDWRCNAEEPFAGLAYLDEIVLGRHLDAISTAMVLLERASALT